MKLIYRGDISGIEIYRDSGMLMIVNPYENDYNRITYIEDTYDLHNDTGEIGQ